MMKVAIILKSTRSRTNVDGLVRWVHEVGKQRSDVQFEFVDITDFDLPLADEPMPPACGEYQEAWAGNFAEFDAFIFVSDFENFSVFKPAARREDAVNAMVDEVTAWGGALKNYGLSASAEVQFAD